MAGFIVFNFLSIVAAFVVVVDDNESLITSSS